MRVQFLDKVATCPLLRRGAVLEQGVDLSVVATTGAWGLTEQKTVEIPQLQFSDMVDMPVVVNDK